MRRIGFYISDFSDDYSGFVVSDLDELISRGTISLLAQADAPAESGPPSAQAAFESATSPEPKGEDAAARYLRDALVALGRD